MVLLHYPVNDVNGNKIVSAVTNLDLHDIARATKTYGVKAFYVITPVREQITFIGRIVDYWVYGEGLRYNKKRADAFNLIRISSSFDNAVREITKYELCKPKIIATTARNYSGIGFENYYGLKEKFISSSKPYILVFGTAWGLSESFLNMSDYVLDPINGIGEYNHLSVRSAVSVILDRLLGIQ